MGRHHHHRSLKRIGKYGWLLGSLILALLFAPVLDDDRFGGSTLSVLTMLTLVLALRAIADERRTLYLGIGLGVIGYSFTALTNFTTLPYHYAIPFQLAFYAFINLSILRSILETRDVSADTICGGICVYLLLGINWALVFAFIESHSPGSLVATGANTVGVSTPMDFIYFSYVTLNTLGYGDIVPVSNGARSAAVGASLSGVLFIAVFIGRLVGLTTSQKDEPKGPIRS